MTVKFLPDAGLNTLYWNNNEFLHRQPSRIIYDLNMPSLTDMLQINKQRLDAAVKALHEGSYTPGQVFNILA